MSTPRLQIYFDYYSPYSYFVSEAIDAVLARHGLAADWRPIDAVRLLRLDERDIYVPAKRRYIDQEDVARCARYYGVPIARPKPWPLDSRPALAMSLAAMDAGCFEAFRRAVFRAAWAERRDIAAPEVLADCMLRAGGDAAALLRRAGELHYAQAIAARTRAARADGVFGVPLMRYRGETYFGRDRLPMLEARLGRDP